MNKKWNSQKNTLFPSVDYSELKKNSDSYKLFIDYLKLWYKKESLFIEKYLKLLVSENSDTSILEFDWYTITFRSFYWKTWRWLLFTVSYNSIPVELCEVQKVERFFWKNSYTKYTIEFKWQYFRLEEMWYFDKWFYKKFSDYLFNSENPNILRVDRTCDFFLKNITKEKKLYLVGPLLLLWKDWIRANTDTKTMWKWKELLELFNPNQSKTRQDTVNRYYWNRKWKRVMLRVYDKLKDLKKETWKWKELLFIDYLKNDKIIRVEFECMYRFCYWYTLETLSELLEKCDSVFHFNDVPRKWSTCYEYKASENIIDLNHKDKEFKIKYFENFWQHWYTIFENNINCYWVLTEHIIKRTESGLIPYSKKRIKQFLNETLNSIND